MKIKLNKIQIENFKGLKFFNADFDGENATIKAANGVGKTSIYDAFLWLLFNKDSSGRKDFDLRPLDDENQPIAGLTLRVAAELDIDGETHLFRKDHEEKVVKGQLRGYETLCYVDDVPKKVSEFQEYVSGLIPEDTFKLLTNLRHFNEGLHWKDRRSVLLEVAGDIETPKGFELLISQLKGRSLDDYKKVLLSQKARFTKDREEINPRIDELQRGLDSYAQSDVSEIESARNKAKQNLAAIEKKRQDLLSGEKERQGKIDALYALKNQQVKRESQLANDTSGVKHLLDEKAQINESVSCKLGNSMMAQKVLQEKEFAIQSEKQRLDSLLRSLNDIREEYNRTSAVVENMGCSLCGQTLPENKQAEIQQRKEKKLAEIISRGNTTKQAVDAQKQKIAALESGLQPLRDNLEKAKIELKEAEDYKSARFAEIDNLIKHNKTTPKEQDAVWLDLNSKIETLSAQIGESVSSQLSEIESDYRKKLTEIEVFNNTLAQADRAKKDAARIIELQDTEKVIAQQIADVDKALADIEAYRAAESGLIESAVNDKFKLVKFKLFNQLLNGSIEETCEASLNGVPYSDCSYGQKLIMGIDIINVLSSHYDISVPLFVDNSESLTIQIESNSQTICLMAQKNVKKLTIDKKGVVANV